jgi:hypothetical protein
MLDSEALAALGVSDERSHGSNIAAHSRDLTATMPPMEIFAAWRIRL